MHLPKNPSTYKCVNLHFGITASYVFQDLYARYTLDTATDFLMGSSTDSLESVLSNTSNPQHEAFLKAFNELTALGALRVRMWAHLVPCAFILFTRRSPSVGQIGRSSSYLGTRQKGLQESSTRSSIHWSMPL
jgi:hypothetical protein